jgi:hypothetical protein
MTADLDHVLAEVGAAGDRAETFRSTNTTRQAEEPAIGVRFAKLGTQWWRHAA